MSDENCARPITVLILVAGPPAVGKTHLAKHLELKYHLPRISKDEFKEAMFDILALVSGKVLCRT